MSYLEIEIDEQPGVVEALLNREAQMAAEIARAIRRFDPALVLIAARGTSDNAARYAQYLLGIHARMPVALATPSIHTLYDAAPTLSGALVIGISQSGQSEDIRRVLDDARKQGALTVSMTNEPDSPLAQSAAYHLSLGAGRERAVAATKTYTAELAAVALLASALVDDALMHEQLARIAGQMRDTLVECESVGDWVERYRYTDRFAVIGRGYNYCTAYEVALKIKELCYITCEQYSEADFRHGPLALIEPGYPVMVVAPDGKAFPLMLDLLTRLQAHGAECLVASNNAGCSPYARHTMVIPDAVPEWLSPLVAVLPGQVFAAQLARTRGHSIDQPRSISKVTNTH